MKVEEFQRYHTSQASDSEYSQDQSQGIELGAHKKKVSGKAEGIWPMRIGYDGQRWGAVMGDKVPTGHTELSET